jgi:excisionase family DNA binding protein
MIEQSESRSGLVGLPIDAYLITKREAAARLRVSVRFVETQVRRRALSVVKLGRAVRFRVKDIEAFVEANRLRAIEMK